MTRSRNLSKLASAYDSGGGFGFRNRIINGDMRIDQRNAGASVNITANIFVVDRFKGFRSGGAATITGQRSTAVPTGFNNSVVLTVGTGAAPGATDYTQFDHNIEGYNVADLGWGTANAQAVTLSFWVRSSLTGTFGVAFRNDAGNRSYVASYTISAANTWEYKTIVIAGDTTGTWLTDNNSGIKMTFDMGVGSTYSNTAGAWAGANYFGLAGGVKLAATAGATFYITGVQLEAGSVASPFERRDYGRELMMCQRYYQAATLTGQVAGTYWLGAIDAFHMPQIAFPVVMRSNPTATAVGRGGGSAFWTNPATSTFSADSTAGWIASATDSHIQLRNTRQAGGSAPSNGLTYFYQSGVIYTASAEL